MHLCYNLPKGLYMKRLILFFGSALLLALAPGPDNCFVLAQSAAQGALAGIAVSVGLMSGVCIHILLAILGAATLIERYPKVADAIAALGACYLLWVAWGMWGNGLSEASATTLPLGKLYLQGILLNLSNPKVILFFMAFLPRFLPTPCPHKMRSLLILGGLFIVAAFTVMANIALLGGTLADALKQSPAIAVWINRLAAGAVALIAVSILIPFARHLCKRTEHPKA